MSWILAVAASGVTPAVRRALERIHPKPLHVFESSGTYLAAGGLEETCLAGKSRRGSWVVVGSGMKSRDGSCDFLDAAAWDHILAPDQPDFENLDGHFVAVRIRGRSVEGFTDQLGLRTLYACRLKAGTAISTRPDWLARLCGGAEIDFGQFGAHWNLFNQLTYASFLKGIERVGPGGKAACTSKTLSVASTPWTPEFSGSTPAELEAAVRSFLQPVLPKKRALALGLSGGIDSRLLLSLLTSNPATPFSTFSFGPNEEPDVRIASTLAHRIGVRHVRLEEAMPSADALLGEVREYVARNTLVAPASGYLRLRYYPQLHRAGKVITDGANGELIRRQFLNRVLLMGRDSLAKGRARAIYPWLKIPRASVFTHDVEARMEDGAVAQIQSAWEGMPRPEEIGIENFLDLLIVRYRYPNYDGFEQARMDEEVVSYMPFVQPSVVRLALNLPLQCRKEGRLHRELIARYCPALSHYPLVKGTVSYPYVLSGMRAWAWMAVKSRLGLCYRDKTPVHFLWCLRDFVMDLVRSQAVRDYVPYRSAEIIHMADAFYGGRRELARELDWWLAFELWRSNLAARAPAVDF